MRTDILAWEVSLLRVLLGVVCVGHCLRVSGIVPGSVRKVLALVLARIARTMFHRLENAVILEAHVSLVISQVVLLGDGVGGRVPKAAQTAHASLPLEERARAALPREPGEAAGAALARQAGLRVQAGLAGEAAYETPAAPLPLEAPHDAALREEGLHGTLAAQRGGDARAAREALATGRTLASTCTGLVIGRLDIVALPLHGNGVGPHVDLLLPSSLDGFV